MEYNLINDKNLKENLADTALGLLQEGKDYHELAYTTVTFGYVFEIDDHGLEVLFKIITDVDTFYFAVQGQKLMALTFTEELFQAHTETFLQLHTAKPEIIG